MFTEIEQQIFENFIACSKQKAALDLNLLTNIISKLDASHFKIIKDLNFYFYSLQIDLAEYDEAQLNAILHFCDAIDSPKEFKITLTKPFIAAVIRTLQLFNRYQIRQLNLSSLDLGKQSLLSLESLIQILEKLDVKEIALESNSLYLLQSDLYLFLNRLLKNTCLNNLNIRDNNLSLLPENILKDLFKLHYQSKKNSVFEPCVVWAHDQIHTEFETNNISDDKKIFLAKKILAQRSKIISYSETPNVIPFTLTPQQYLSVCQHYLDNMQSQKDFDQHFIKWHPEWLDQLSQQEKLSLAIQATKKFPQCARSLNRFQLKYYEGVQLPEAIGIAFANWVYDQHEIDQSRRTSIYRLPIYPFHSNSEVIESFSRALTRYTRIHALDISLNHLSPALVKQLGEMIFKSNRYMQIKISHLQLSNQEDFDKLALLLDCFPSQYALCELELYHCILDEIQIDKLNVLNLFNSISFDDCNLDHLGKQLLPFLKNLKCKEIKIEQKGLDSLPAEVLDGIVNEFKNNPHRSLYLSYPTLRHVASLPNEVQYENAKRILQFQMLSNIYSYPILGSHVLTQEQLFKLFWNFMEEAPTKKFKIQKWISHHAPSFTEQQRLTLTQKFMEGIQIDFREDPLNSFKLQPNQIFSLYFNYVMSPQSDLTTENLASLINHYVVLRNDIDDEIEKNPALNQFLEQTFLKLCQQHWPHLSFYQSCIERLMNYPLHEGYDIKKLTNMLAWFIHTIVALFKKPNTSLDVNDKQAKHPFLEKIFKEILNYAEPESRANLSKQLIKLLEKTPAVLLFNQIAEANTQRAILPALILSNIIFTVEDAAAREHLISKAKFILKHISNNYCEGRHLQSIVNTLLTLEESLEISAIHKINIICSIIQTNDTNEWKQIFTAYAYALASPNPEVKLAATQKLTAFFQQIDWVPDSLKSNMLALLDAKEIISKDRANKLKRQWQSQLTSHIKNKFFIQQLNSLLLTQGLGQLNEMKGLIDCQNIYAHLLNTVAKLFHLTDANKDAYAQTLGIYQNHSAILTYLGKLKTLNLPEFVNLFIEFIQDILTPQQQAFLDKRYDVARNKHLATIFKDRSTLLQMWRLGRRMSFKSFLESNQIETKKQKLSAEQFITEKILLHKHLPLMVTDLKNYLEAGSAELKQEIKTQLSVVIDRNDSSINVNDLRAETYKLKFQFNLIQAIENQDDAKKSLRFWEEAQNNLSFLNLNNCEFYNDIEFMIKALSPKQIKKVDTSKWSLVDTDHFWYLFTCGNLPGSCQRVDGNPNLNRGLLGYILDGKNRLLAILDENNNLIARCIFRLLFDVTEQKPVLFLESYYCEGVAEEYAGVLKAFARERAKDLNLDLVNFNLYTYSNETNYPNKIISLDCPAPFEYVDALHTQIPKGQYSIHKAKILYHYQPQLKRSQSFSNFKYRIFKYGAENKSQDDLLNRLTPQTNFR